MGWFAPRLPLVVAAALLLAPLSGCRTRLWSLLEVGLPDSADAGLPSDAGPVIDLTVPRDNCGVYQIATTQIIRADLLVLQDKSRSMTQGINGLPNPPAGHSKWELVRAAIEQVVASTTAVDWGLMLFGSDGQCHAPDAPDVAVGPGNAAHIRATLDATQPNANTPTAVTLRNAVTYFAGLDDGHPHYLMVATDGQPTCSNGGGNPGGDDSANTIREVQAAAEVGINTFVVGIGSNTGADDTLSQMAEAGGVPNTAAGQPSYYPVTSTQDLVTLLQKAALQITPCSYPLSHDPPAPDRVTIQGTSGTIPRDRTRTNGWDYSEDGRSVEFFGAACDQLRDDVVTSVEAIYGCPGDL